ncbi:transcriptional regulator, TetR family [Desulfotomaculum arcticum]|uniref:Transcriptional regulator, TetR family n=1 Tax=Desulfotruncus arcticus DSM 17038 TaxID=1121424 RepID=A0A1I2Q5C8_9FIRM|nr:TetR/AcrR family transcriptional regulator [Desulfotruncus arcticus]SFG23534.1 transcriptional regulator, TetR family [Desulfotomaculum arcticum] [Desulfotruncus arcticus DSM 17038]
MGERGNRQEDTKERLLFCAERIFAQKGLDGARVDEIAAEAEVNKRMIYHYFQSKENLYVEVLKYNFGKVYALGEKVFDPVANPLDNLCIIIREYFYFLANNENFIRLLSWENLYDSRHARRLLSGYLKNAMPGLSKIFQAGVSKGQIRPDVDVNQLIISIHGLCLVYLTRKELLHSLWREDMVSPVRLEERLNHIINLVLRGIAV